MRKYVEFQYTFEQLKNKIDLVSFFLDNFRDYTYEKKKKGYTLRNTNGDLIDLFLFFNDNGTQKYWNPLSAHGGDLLSFVKNNDLVKSDGSDKGYYYNLNVLLHEYTGDPNAVKRADIPTDIYNEKQSFFNYFELTNDISDINDPKNKAFIEDYLSFRQIDFNTLNNPVFKDKLFVLKQENPSNEKTYTYISSKIQSIYNGTPVGLTRKNKDYNGIERNSARGRGFFISNYNPDKQIKAVYIFESWEDSLAYFELFKLSEKENNVFIATNGNYSEQQKKDLAHFIEKNNINNVNLCNDNDIAGSLYNMGMLSELTQNLNVSYSVIRSTENDPINTTILIKAEVNIKDLKAIDKSAFVKLTGDVSTNYNKESVNEYKAYISTDNVKSIDLENELIMVSQKPDKKTFDFYIPYKYQPLSLFNKYIIATDNNKLQKLIINKPQSNDFNQDLKESKANTITKKKGPKL